jgi:hypothetical protein
MVLNEALANLSAALRVGMPGTIQKFDPATQLADVKPLCPNVFTDETGSTVVESIPVIANVPVQFIGGGDFTFTHPVAVGESCWLMFADRSIDPWLDNGKEADPVDLRKHDFSDAVAVVGIRPKSAKLSEFDNARAVWGKQGGKKIALKQAEVHLGVDHGQDATEAAALMTAYTADENAMLNAVGINLAAAQAALTAAQAALASAASANAVPIYGGAAAAPEFIASGVQLGLVGVQLQAAKAQLTQFVQKDATHKSVIVKVK